ncbi:zinc finger domain-containing protein, partial [Tubulinosema ratisbonensis]
FVLFCFKFINSFEEKCICKNVNVFKTESLEYLENKKKEKIECVHYKESCRMFVFPCCKNVYSCPKCHDKNERHKFEYAYQMICLVCNKKVSVKDVCDCGYVHIKKKSVFWEGGKGKRDKITMSKKDSKKYK